MKYSLINVHGTHEDGTIWGSWIQNHIGTLESAKMVAEETNRVNSNRLDIAVVEDVMTPTPILDLFYNRVRL